jgi:hypothetical protein
VVQSVGSEFKLQYCPPQAKKEDYQELPLVEGVINRTSKFLYPEQL